VNDTSQDETESLVPDEMEDENEIIGEPPVELEEQELQYGTAFEKLDEYSHRLGGPNPWHRELKRPLFPAQIIGSLWMRDRDSVGGGLVQDQVGMGKVSH
jgi:hypothetical protein